MPKAGFCKKCKALVWVTETGSCCEGHPPSSVSNVYETRSEGSFIGARDICKTNSEESPASKELSEMEERRAWERAKQMKKRGCVYKRISEETGLSIDDLKEELRGVCPEGRGLLSSDDPELDIPLETLNRLEEALSEIKDSVLEQCPVSITLRDPSCRGMWRAHAIWEIRCGLAGGQEYYEVREDYPGRASLTNRVFFGVPSLHPDTGENVLPRITRFRRIGDAKSYVKQMIREKLDQGYS